MGGSTVPIIETNYTWPKDERSSFMQPTLIVRFSFFATFSQGAGGRDEEATVSRYSSQYEQRLDPFSAFNQRVRGIRDYVYY